MLKATSNNRNKSVLTSTAVYKERTRSERKQIITKKLLIGAPGGLKSRQEPKGNS